MLAAVSAVLLERMRLSTEFADDPSTPERRLWIAIILMALTEYEEVLKQVDAARRYTNRPVNREIRLRLRQLRYECEHDWFRHVCELAEFEQSDVIGRMAALDEQYTLSKVNFTEAPVRIRSVWNIPKLKRRRLKNNA